MRKQLTMTAVAVACLVLGAGGATLYTHAATGPAVYNVYEANVTDEAAYTKALPEVQKVIKETGGEYIAGGFNKAKLVRGKPAIGNRFVIIRYPNQADYEKGQSEGIKAWVDKNAPEAREIVAQGVEMK